MCCSPTWAGSKSSNTACNAGASVMPLHRDIHWLGRQWAVTGHGLQLINQKQRGYYDIEAARLGEAHVIEAMQSKAWIDRPDFDRALEIARAKFAHVARADPAPAEPPPAVAAPPPVRAAPPDQPRAPLEPPSVPTIEELLARLKTKSAAAAKSAEAPATAAPGPTGSDAQTIEPPKPEPPPSPLEVVDRPRNPATAVWPVFERKIAGSARFVSPWRVRSARWHGPSSGLPPRP